MQSFRRRCTGFSKALFLFLACTVGSCEKTGTPRPYSLQVNTGNGAQMILDSAARAVWDPSNPPYARIYLTGWNGYNQLALYIDHRPSPILPGQYILSDPASNCHNCAYFTDSIGSYSSGRVIATIDFVDSERIQGSIQGNLISDYLVNYNYPSNLSVYGTFNLPFKNQ